MSRTGRTTERRSPETIAREHVMVDDYHVLRVLTDLGAWAPVRKVASGTIPGMIRSAIAAAIRADRKQRKGARGNGH